MLPIRLSKAKVSKSLPTVKLTDVRLVKSREKAPNAGGFGWSIASDGVNGNTWVTTGGEEPGLNPVAVISQADARVTKPCSVATSQP